MPVDESIDTVARTIYGEARSTGMLDRMAVGAVIRERVLRPGWWGRDWVSVCKAPNQFTCWTEGDPNRPKLLYAEADPTGCFLGIYALAQYVVRDMTDEDVRALFGDAEEFPTHYFSAPLTEPPKAWGRDIQQVGPTWVSPFDFYVVRQGRPARKDGPVQYVQG